MAARQLAHRHERQAQGSFCCGPGAHSRWAAAADQSQGSPTSAWRGGLAGRRTADIRRKEILSCQSAARNGPAHLGSHRQSAMGLRTGAPATERRTRSRSFRGPILSGSSPPCAYDDDRLRLPPLSSAENSRAGKKNRRPPAAPDSTCRAPSHPRPRRSATPATMSTLPKMDFQRKTALINVPK